MKLNLIKVASLFSSRLLGYREFAYASKMMPEIKPDVWKYLAIYMTKNQIINLAMHHKVALAMIEQIFGNPDYSN